MVHSATIPGVGRRTAEVIVAEIGTRTCTVFRRPATWLRGGSRAGQQRERGEAQEWKNPQGQSLAATALVEAAQAAGRSKKTALGAYYRRIAARRGRKRALIATAHRIVEAG